MSTEYKPNSHRSKQMPEKKVEKVVRGKVKTKPKGGISKMTDVFVSEDIGKVKSYIFMDVIVPAIKKAISECVREGIDMILYGDSRGRRGSSNSSYVSYRDYSRRDDDRRRDSDRETPRSRGALHENIFLPTRGEAEEVLTRMDELIEVYEVVSIGDLYELIGEPAPPYTAERYGWTSLRTADIVRTRDGYLLKLPKAVPID